jgi:flagellar protein FlaG
MSPAIGYASAVTAVDTAVAPAPRAATQQDAAQSPRSSTAKAVSPPTPPRAPPPGLQAFDLRFRVDPDLHEVVVTMVDPDSGNVLRQIPSEDALKLAKALESIGKQFFEDQA